MDHANQIKQAVRDIVPKPIQHLYLAKVIAVQADTCTIQIDSLTLSDVLLRPVFDTSQTPFRITPAVGSFVIVADLSIGHLQHMAVVAVSEAQKIEISGAQSGNTPQPGSTPQSGNNTQPGSGGTQIEINGGTNGGLINIESLKSYLEALKQSISNSLSAVGVGNAANGPAAQTAFDSAMQSASHHLQTLEDQSVTH